MTIDEECIDDYAQSRSQKAASTMTTISIREHGTLQPGPVVSIDGQEYPITVADPFSEQEEKRLEWYFEEHLRFPFTESSGGSSSRGQRHRLRRAAVPPGLRRPGRLRRLPRRDPGEPGRADCGDRRLAGLPAAALGGAQGPQAGPAIGPPSCVCTAQPDAAAHQGAACARRPRSIVLLVTARPGGARDVGYRTIARPLVATLRKAQLRVQVDILRPGTLRGPGAPPGSRCRSVTVPATTTWSTSTCTAGCSPTKQFDRLEQGLDTDHFTYQLRRYGRPALPQYEGVKAFLFMEHAQAGHADPVEATELAGLLQVHGIPIVVLNACQSGKQVGDQETSLGSQLMLAGVQMVLAMGYSVTVSAAERLMAEFYAQLFGGASLGAALRSARLELYNRKGRRAYFNQTIELEDWLLPVVYENRPQALRPREFTAEESTSLLRCSGRRLRRTQGGLPLCRARPGCVGDRAPAARPAQHPPAARHGRRGQDHAAPPPGLVVADHGLRGPGLLLRLRPAGLDPPADHGRPGPPPAGRGGLRAGLPAVGTGGAAGAAGPAAARHAPFAGAGQPGIHHRR